MYENPPSAAASAPPEAAKRNHEFKFTGDAAEYFGIWIVNLFLSIITLGIYSAWAKVRKKRYFYGHTWVAESNFEYHGNPVAILKGRIIAFAALVIYLGSGYYSQQLALGILLVLSLLAPWLIARSMAFNAINSSYRQIRFHFKASYQDVFMAIWPLILFVCVLYFMPQFKPEQTRMPSAQEWATLFLPTVIAMLAYPYVVGSIKRLHISHSAYGAAPLTFSAGIGQFYKLYLAALGIAIVGILALALAIFVLAMIPVVGWLAIPFAYIFFGALLMGYLRARVTNLTFNSTTLDGHVALASTMSPMRLSKIYFVNLLVIVFTLGLMIPWAAVRVARYRAEVLALESATDLEAFLAQAGREVGATGEEMGEFFDVDLSL